MKLGKIFAFSALSFGRQSGAYDYSVGDGNATIEVQDNPLLPAINENLFAHDDDDADIVAESFGMSIDEARKYLDQQDDFSELIAGFQNDERFLKANYASELNGEFKVFYKNGDVPTSYRDAVKKFKENNRNASLKFVKARLSRQEAQLRRNRIIAKLTKKGYSNIISSIEGDNLRLTAKKPLKSRRRKNRGIMSKIRAAKILGLSNSDGDLSGLNITLLNDDDIDPFEDYDGYGGRELTDAQGTSCTSGFSVVHCDGRVGLSTAGHCGDMKWYWEPPDDHGARVLIEKTGHHIGLWGDMAWYHAWYLDTWPYAYFKPRQSKAVKRVANDNDIQPGKVVCLFSRRFGNRKCSKIKATEVQRPIDGYRAYNMVEMDKHFGGPGDSGGPWTYNYKAFGVVQGSRKECTRWSPETHHGYSVCEQWRNFDIWTRADHFYDAMNVQVMLWKEGGGFKKPEPDRCA